MNEIRLDDKPGRCELIVRIGDRFQAVEIKKTADRHDIARDLRIWADNIERDKLMGGPTCGTCIAFERMDGKYGWCPRNNISVIETSSCCTEYHQ